MASEIEVTRMREALKRTYSGEKWSKRVEKMPSKQVVAVYLRFKAQNKI